MLRAPAQQVYAATRQLLLERPAMTTMPARPMMLATRAALVSEQRWFAPPPINAMLPAPAPQAYAATQRSLLERPAMTTICVRPVMLATRAALASEQR